MFHLMYYSSSFQAVLCVPQHEFDLLRFNSAWTMGKIILLRANGAMISNYGTFLSGEKQASGIANMNTCET